MSDRRPLSHLIYTNTPGEGGHGFRVLTVGFPGTAEERKRIEAWMMGLKLADEKQIGWAASSFLVKRSPCFALAVVDSISFPRDDVGRHGLFVHALLLQIDEGKPVGDFGLAAFDKATAFLEARPESPTLDHYLQGCRVNTGLEIPELRYNNFRGLDPRFLEAFYSAACEGAEYAAQDELPEHLLAASAALPPRLRLGVSWRVGLKPGPHTSKAKPGSPAPKNLGTAYLDSVQARLKAGRDDRVARFASTDWDVRSWSEFGKTFGPSGGKPSRPEPARPKPAAAPPAKNQASYNEEYQALEKNLRDYFEQRLFQVLSPSPAKEDRRTWISRWYQAWRPEIYFLILLLLGAASHLSLWQAITSGARERLTAGPVPSPAPVEAHRRNPLTAWKEFVESPEAVAWFRSISNAHGLEDRQVTSSMRAKFAGWASQLDRGRPLSEIDLESSRTGFFEYVHARWAKDAGLGHPYQDVVSLSPYEAAPQLERLARDFDLMGELGPVPSVDDPEVQAEIALAWIQRHPTP